MKELNYKKIICALGHSSEAVPFDMPLPGKCPVCGQPYDRRYNRPVPCLRDGTVPEEEADQRERQAAAGEEGGDIPTVRGRRNMPAADPDMQIHMTGTRRRRTAGEAGTEEVPCGPRRPGGEIPGASCCMPAGKRSRCRRKRDIWEETGSARICFG